MADSPGRRTLISVWATRGGHGATTVAGAIGSFLKCQVLSPEPDAFQWLWPEWPKTRRGSDYRVTDAGLLCDGIDRSHINIVVLRGPCSLGLMNLAAKKDSIDSLILIREPWRTITAQDIEDALDMRISAEVPQSVRIARLADAGLLTERVHMLNEFAELKEWVANRWPITNRDTGKESASIRESTLRPD